MKPGERERPTHGRREPGLGWRGPGWLGALMLCVVLAAAGMPAAGGVIADATRIEACHGRTVRALPYAAARLAADDRPGAGAVTAALPRPRPRAQTIAAGGLPPPRAPTV